ncbi:unnamed protein product [Caenorhabditis bovis]|uniref:aralkylamine N-acetyltransferase n=1 Tax=Caenorhabditis bovis TaxID=2654633 RepID=A0A8S1EDV3_9PELO|nr:unnamed protein product [Caenorhabditis bovis]
MENFEFKIGLKEHQEVVHQFLLNHFRVSEPITVSLDCQEADVEKFFADLASGGLNNEKYSILVFHNEKLVAVCLNSVKISEKWKPEFQEQIYFNPHFDYAKEIASGPYTEPKANRLVSFVNALEYYLELLADYPMKILKIDVLCVSKEYQGQGLAKKLVVDSLAKAVENDCDFVATVATARASQSIFAKSGLVTLQEMPFSCFRENGVPVFQNLPDDGVSGKLMGISLSGEKAKINEDDEDLR